MGKKLAIKGHSTRGKEVIEILEMMGGTNPFTINNGTVIGNKVTNCYYISEDIAKGYISWDYIGPEEIDKYKIFTFEEFLEKYPFKVGDKVMNCYGDSFTIKSMSWFEDCETMVYAFENTAIVLSAEDLLKYNAEFLVSKEKGEEADKMLGGFILDHLHRNHLKNVLSELLEHIKTTPKEDLEREFEEIESEGWFQIGPSVEEFIDFCNKINKKPKYLTTYEECCGIMGIPRHEVEIDLPQPYQQKMFNLFKLLICRDTYWKIAGEEMGLDKPWEPDWTSGKPCYCISVSGNIIGKGKWCVYNKILALPIEEMRDAFYENFKDLIESCKELL